MWCGHKPLWTEQGNLWRNALWPSGGVEVRRSNLGRMLEVAPLEPWIAVNLPLVRLAVACMACMWLLMAAFERETQRWKWAWSQPRKLLARNASETPRTLGVVTSHAVAVLGWAAGLCTAGWVPTASAGLWWALVAIFGDGVSKTVAGWVTFKDRDLASSMVEVNRHNRTWQGLLLALWAVTCAMQPWLAHADWAVLITWGWMAVLLGVGALRASSLVSGKTHLPGMLYLCVLEWGWMVSTLAWMALHFT